MCIYFLKFFHIRGLILRKIDLQIWTVIIFLLPPKAVENYVITMGKEPQKTVAFLYTEKGRIYVSMSDHY